jgi:DNA polymerase III delta prime subunit
MPSHQQLLSEVLRPRHLGDLTIPQRCVQRLQRMLDERNVMNMIFYGRAGTGKTSAARIIAGHEDFDCFTINGSSASGIDYVRDKIESFAHTGSVYLRKKICFIDEADGLSKAAQMALRHLMEQSSGNCRFLFTANEISKLLQGIQSRMQLVCFDIFVSDADEILARLRQRYRETLNSLGIDFDEKLLDEITAMYFPDLRSIANRIEFEFC